MAQREDIIRKFETNYSALLKQLDEDNKNSIENQIERLNKQKDAIEKASDEQIEKLNNLKSAYEELFNDLSTDSAKWVESIIEKWDLDISVKEDLLSLLKVRKDELLNAKTEAEKPLAYNNDIVTIISQMMGYSQKWSKAITQQDKDQLHEKNVGLADELNRKGLKVHFDNEKYSWFDENGNAIYSEEFLEKLEKDQKNAEENRKSTDTNTDVTENNTTSTDSNTNATKDNNKVLKSAKDALGKATSAGNDIVEAAENLIDALNNRSNSNSSSSSGSGNSSGSDNSGTVTSPTDGTSYTYSSVLTGEDIDTAKEWFADNHKTYPGDNITVIGGSVSALSSSLISELGLKSGDLVVLGKTLYYIGSSGVYKKISSSLVKGYKKGSDYIPYSQLAVVDEEGIGSEVIAHKDTQGRLTYLEKGSEVVPAGRAQSLARLFEISKNPDLIKALFPDNRPPINPFENLLKEINSVPSYITNNINNQNTSNTINNYNIDSVELKNVNNVDDMFRGLTNMARQRAYKR